MTDVQGEDGGIVLPGDILGDENFRSGSGTYLHEGKIISTRVGFVNISRDYINIIPLNHGYLPKTGDSVIGLIIDNGPSSWMVDICCPYNAMMHVNDVPPKIEYGNTANFLKPGDAILAKVSGVNEIKKIQLTLKEHGLRKLEGGTLIRLSHSKVPRLIGKGGSMISLIKNKTGVKMFIGQNGMVWVDGDSEAIDIATKSIAMINDGAHTSGLTDKVRSYLEEHCGQGVE